MGKTLPTFCAIAAFIALSVATFAAASNDRDYAIQGEYSGDLNVSAGPNLPAFGAKKHGIQVIALGDHKFRAAVYPGGLPSDGWDGKTKVEINGQTADGVTTLVGAGKAAGVTLTIKDGSELIVTQAGQKELGGTLKKVLRKSPTLGAKPPEGAVILFDGSGGDEWAPGDMDGKLLKADVSGGGQFSKRKFHSFTLHIEFQLPFEPAKRGQDRGNSGVYMQARYETQVLDSFGLSNADNECGGIYSIAKSAVQMCFPPLSWQTYDIDYTAAQFENGKKTKNARMSVKLNGVEIHKDVELTHATTAAPWKEGPEPGPIYLQNHGHPVRFQNIWLVEKK